MDANINKGKPPRKIRIRGRQFDNFSVTIGKENNSVSGAAESIQVGSESRDPLSREYHL